MECLFNVTVADCTSIDRSSVVSNPGLSEWQRYGSVWSTWVCAQVVHMARRCWADGACLQLGQHNRRTFTR